MKFSQLAIYIQQIDKTQSRLEITRLLSELYLKLNKEEIDKTIYLMQGRVAPLFDPVEFGMAEKSVIKAAVSAMQIDPSLFKTKYQEIGDIGKTVEYFKNQYHSFEEMDLEIIVVFEQLQRLAKASGNGSQTLKQGILSLLIRQLNAVSCCYLVRIPLGILRLGFSDMTVLDALSWMLTGDKKLRGEIEHAYHVLPDLGMIGKIVKKDGIKGIKTIKPKLFTPIIMMRAERLSSGEEIIKQIGRCAIEPKYDGFRLQAHFDRKLNQVKLYSRNLEEVSLMFPDIVEGIKKQIHGDKIIIEGETVGFDPKTGKNLPFQETVQRKRKYDIEKTAKIVPLKFFVFELLYIDGISYLSFGFEKRREKLTQMIEKNKNLVLAPQKIINDGKLIETYFDQAVSDGLEGIMAKKLDGIYQPGARGWNWIKFKRSYSSKVNDTIDCLVMGYDLGKGKRTGFGIGAFLAGVYDEKNEQYLTVAKIGTGLTDEEWKQLKIKSQKSKVKSKPEQYIVNKMMECDVWLAPKIVVEIRADEITHSPVHTAKLALRFPRLERFRDDKIVTEITTITELGSIINNQIIK